MLIPGPLDDFEKLKVFYRIGVDAEGLHFLQDVGQKLQAGFRGPLF